jgi:mannose-6-phosphate isomerase-like protein (cupin superfamily)
VFYRLATFVLLALTLVMTALYAHAVVRRPAAAVHRTAAQPQAVAQARSVAPDAVTTPEVVDLTADVARINQGLSANADVSHTFYLTAAASVHLHALGRQQMCPLHLHPASKEATVIVSGRPVVDLVYARGGVPVREKHSLGPGALVYSPAFSGHQWVNTSAEEMQANLVFTAPPFAGNFYVQENDARLRRAQEPPAVVDPGEALRSFTGRGTPGEVLDPGIMDGMISLVLVNGTFHLDADPNERVLYVARGSGVLAAGRKIALREKLLLVIPAGFPIDFQATAGAPLAIFAFRTAPSSPAPFQKP